MKNIAEDIHIKMNDELREQTHGKLWYPENYGAHGTEILRFQDGENDLCWVWLTQLLDYADLYKYWSKGDYEKRSQ